MNHNSAGCLGALGLLVLTITCPLVSHTPIEQYLKAQSEAALRRDGLIGRPAQDDWRVVADGLDISLFGPASESSRAQTVVEKELANRVLWPFDVKVLRPGSPPQATTSPQATVAPTAASPEALMPEATAKPEGEPTPAPKADGFVAGTTTGLVQVLSHEGTTYVRGAYPNDATRSATVQAVQAALGGAVKDETTLSGSDGELGWPAQILKALSALKSVKGLELSAGGDVLTIAGTVLSGSERQKLQNVLKTTLPSGVTLENLLTLAGERRLRAEPSQTAALPTDEREQAQAIIDTVVGSGEVLFATASSRIKAETYPYLNQIAETLKAQSNATVTVGGHTDNEGQEDANLRLSQKRADSVRAYLVAQGVPALHLFARGYGSSQPIAPNDAEDGRRKNRRIGFTVR